MRGGFRQARDRASELIYQKVKIVGTGETFNALRSDIPDHVSKLTDEGLVPIHVDHLIISR